MASDVPRLGSSPNYTATRTIVSAPARSQQRRHAGIAADRSVDGRKNRLGAAQPSFCAALDLTASRAPSRRFGAARRADRRRSLPLPDMSVRATLSIGRVPLGFRPYLVMVDVSLPKSARGRGVVYATGKRFVAPTDAVIKHEHDRAFQTLTRAVLVIRRQVAFVRSVPPAHLAVPRGDRWLADRLATGQLDAEADLLQSGGHLLAVVALDLDHAVLHGAARAAEALELGCDLGELRLVTDDAGHDGDRLAAAPLALA